MSWRKFQWKCFHLYLRGGVWWRWLAGDKWRARWKVSVDAAVDRRRWGGGHKKGIQATWEKISPWERMGVNMIRRWRKERKERKKCKIGKEDTWWNDLPRNSVLCGLDDELVCSAMGFNMVCDSWYRHVFPRMTVKLRNLLSGGISFTRENRECVSLYTGKLLGCLTPSHEPANLLSFSQGFCCQHHRDPKNLLFLFDIFICVDSFVLSWDLPLSLFVKISWKAVKSPLPIFTSLLTYRTLITQSRHWTFIDWKLRTWGRIKRNNKYLWRAFLVLETWVNLHEYFIFHWESTVK